MQTRVTTRFLVAQEIQSNNDVRVKIVWDSGLLGHASHVALQSEGDGQRGAGVTEQATWPARRLIPGDSCRAAGPGLSCGRVRGGRQSHARPPPLPLPLLPSLLSPPSPPLPSRRARAPGRLTLHPGGGVAFTDQPSRALPRTRPASPRTLPSRGGPATPGRARGLPQPAAPPAPRTDSGPARLPSFAPSAPHLLCRHRPFPRAAAAALAGATAALRHLRRPLRFRPARPRPRASHPAWRLPPPGPGAAASRPLLRSDAADGFGSILMLGFIIRPPHQLLPLLLCPGLRIPRLSVLCAQPRECGLWLSLGGFHERGQDWEQTQKIYNCHVLLNNEGSVVATYRKTHLCDVEIPGQGPMRESNSTIPGPSLESPVSTPAGKIGLAICYDMRFPELSLALAQAGAEILTYPSAFGSVTGPAHWEVLLRARAIETQCYVVAAAQCGRHHEKRASYGHSMVVDPWGTVVARCSEGPGLCLARIDLNYLRQLRQHLPVFQHRRPDLYGNLGHPLS
uniref:Deaminated glutathione amidase n=2 Tax=Canis lupus familiaris TaxID=9615 RepID=A0A8C0RNF4_CANLF